MLGGWLGPPASLAQCGRENVLVETQSNIAKFYKVSTISRFGTPNGGLHCLMFSQASAYADIVQGGGRPGHPYGQLPPAYAREIRHSFRLSSPLVSLGLLPYCLRPPSTPHACNMIQESTKTVADTLPPCDGIIAWLPTHPMAPP